MKTRYVFLSMVGLVAIAASTQAAITFKTLDFPGFPSAVRGISDGTVFGAWSTLSNGVVHGFIYNGSAFTTVDYPGANFTDITGVSGHTVVGEYQVNSEASHGFIYDGSTYKALSFPDGGLDAGVAGVSGGKMVGTYAVNDPFTRYHGFIYDGSKFTTLDFPGAPETVVNAISGAIVVGYYQDSTNYAQHGFIYDGSTFKTVDAPGAPQGQANQGTQVQYVSGAMVITSGNGFFIYDGATFTQLNYPGGTGTLARGISGGGVVGTYSTYSDGAGISHGFVYDGSTYTTLDVPGATKDTIPMGICGNTVVGNYSDIDGSPHGFVAQLSEPLPRISPAMSNTAVISWPYPSTGWHLQQNSDLTTTNWVAPPQAIANDGTNNFIILNSPSGKLFFRLSYP